MPSSDTIVLSAPSLSPPKTPPQGPPSLGSRDPRWLLLSHTLPAGVIFATYLTAFGLIGTLLDEQTLLTWKVGAAILGATHLLFLILGIQLWRSNREVPSWAAILSVGIHSLITAYVLSSMNDLLPREIPNWMFPPEILRLSMALPMIPALHSLYILVQASLQRNDSILRTLGMVVLIPILCYAVSTR